MSVAIERVTPSDVAEMAAAMRQEDAAEVMLISGQTPLEALESSIAISGSQAWAVKRCDKLMAIWGIADVSLVSGVAVPWLLTTHEVDRHPKDFLLASKRAVEFLSKRYKIAMNHVDARYDKALRWAKYLGFELWGPADGLVMIILRGA